MLIRREFISISGFTLAGLIVPRSALATATIPGSKNWMIEELSREVFERHLNESFTISHAQHGTTALTLVLVEEIHQRVPKGGPKLSAFSAVFEGHLQVGFPQDNYTLENPRFGRTELFVVPVESSNPKARQFEVSINRVVRD